MEPEVELVAEAAEVIEPEAVMELDTPEIGARWGNYWLWDGSRSFRRWSDWASGSEETPEVVDAHVTSSDNTVVA